MGKPNDMAMKNICSSFLFFFFAVSFNSIFLTIHDRNTTLASLLRASQPSLRVTFVLLKTIIWKNKSYFDFVKSHVHVTGVDLIILFYLCYEGISTLTTSWRAWGGSSFSHTCWAVTQLHRPLFVTLKIQNLDVLRHMVLHVCSLYIFFFFLFDGLFQI